MTAAKNMIREVSTTTGTGNLVVNGAAAGYQSLSDAYGADAPNLLLRLYQPGGAWEVGLYDYTHATRTIVRSSGLIASSTGSLIDWPEGTIIVEPVVPPHDDEHDGTYLRLDATNDPVTGDLRLSQELHVDGDVGIGTTAPQRTLDIQAAVPSQVMASIQNLDSSGFSGIEFPDHTGAVKFFFGVINSNGSARLNSLGGAHMEFRTSGIERVRITGAGRVGIGDSTPSYDLDVNSNINAQGQLTEAGFRAIAVETDGRFKVALYSDSTPRGFSRVTGVDGAVIRLEDTSGAGTSQTGGSRQDVAFASTEDHVLAVAEMPGHTHPVPGSTEVQSGTGATIAQAPGINTDTTGSTGGGGGHNHSIFLKYSSFGLYQFDGA